MPRPKYNPNSEFPYHIGSRACNRQQFPLPLDEVWDIMCSQLALTDYLFNFKTHAFVLMPNHFHLLCSTPEANLAQAMHFFIGETSREFNLRSGRINQNFGRRYFRCLISSEHYYRNSYKYVYRNPVEAGLCKQVEEYRYSTLQMYLGLAPIEIPLQIDGDLIHATDDTLKWLNQATSAENWLAVRKALQKGQFKLPKISKARLPHSLEKSLI